MSEVDPDPNAVGRSELGGRPEPSGGDPTEGGRRGQIGEAPSIAGDEPDDGTAIPPGGGNASPEPDAVPVADPGPDA